VIATASTWDYVHYDPAEERLRGSLCTLGNGYFATRGALPECAADDVHYPGTYVAGCYNRLTSTVAGREVENEDMVNLPNWPHLSFRSAGGDWLTPDTAPVRDHRQTVHLDSGVLERLTRFALGDGRALTVRQLRLAHRPEIAVPASDLLPIDVRLPDRDIRSGSSRVTPAGSRSRTDPARQPGRG
jgi:trehalose/maltose hydrolase-like predicted phosphorylase